jgi:hypothetical protein
MLDTNVKPPTMQFRTSCLAIGLILLTCVSAIALPQIRVVGGDTVNWGKVYDGKLKANVQIVNVGNASLTIDTLQPSCGCTLAPIDRTTLQPGDTATAHVSVDASHESGLVLKSLFVRSNDPGRPSFNILLTARIAHDLNIYPPVYYVLGEMAPGDNEQTAVRLRNEGTSPISIEPPSTIDSGSCTFSFGQTGRIPANTMQI